MYFLGIDTRSETPHPDVWIIVPAFGEAAVIGDVITGIRSVFASVVCVDDGSTDDTAAIARRAGARLFATFDADGQHQVADVVRMIERLDSADLDIVIGTRFAAPEAAAAVPLLKRLVLRAAVALNPRIRRLGLSDAHNGLRVFNRRVADGLDLTMNGMSHAGEFIALIAENGWRVGEEPVEVLYTDYSKAKGQPLLNGVNIMFDGLLRKRMSR